MLAAAIAELYQVYTGQEMLTRPQQDRGDGNVHLLDGPGRQVLPERGNAPAQPNVAAARGLGGNTGQR